MQKKQKWTWKQILKEYLKFQFKARKTYFILSLFFIFYWLVVLIDFIVQHRYDNYKFLNSINTSIIITFVGALLAYGLKMGLLNKTINNFKNINSKNTKIKEQKKLMEMSESQKQIFYKQKELQDNYYNSFYYKTSFGYVLNLILWTIIFVINIIITYA